jgi:hypothetical protein
MRLASHEVRWFFDGDLDESGPVFTWFARRDWLRITPGAVELTWPGFEKREDVYSVLKAQDLGLKWRSDERGTSLDVKGRTAELGPVQFGPKAVGNVERWIKWQYKNDSVPEAIRAAFDAKMHGGELVSVRKNRLLRKVRLDAFGKDEEVALSAFIDRGLNIELTKLRLSDGGAHWTLGVEAFPHDDDLHGAFCRNVSGFLSGYAGPPLALDSSRSYPQWLAERRGRPL